MILFRAAALLVLVAVVTGSFNLGIVHDPVEKELDEVLAYIDELDTLNEEETRPFDAEEQFHRPEGEAFESACVAMAHPLPVTSANYVSVVQKTLAFWNRCLALWNSKVSYSEWDYNTDLSTRNEQKLNDVEVNYSAWTQSLSRAARMYKDNPSYNWLDPDSQRQLRLLAFSTTANDPDVTKQLVEVSSRLLNAYSTAKVDGLSLEPDLTEKMSDGRDSNMLLAAWWGWRNATGPYMKDNYEKMNGLLNAGARDNGYESYAEAWLESQFDETPALEDTAERLWEDLKPLYQEVHAYVRHKLMEQYASSPHKHQFTKKRSGGNNHFGYFQEQLDSIFEMGGIPAHVTGNMWAQDWSNIYDIVKPFDLPEVDYNKALLKNGYDVEKLFDTAEQFYTSIGLFEMTPKFDSYSMKVRPADGREVVCHASASDFYNSDDFRIKMCTEVNMGAFETIHHEMGHIEYFMAYRDQPAVYRDGANSAFHEAIGDVISLSVLTPQHLHAIGLASEEEEEGERRKSTASNSAMTEQEMRDINYLMKKALFKVAFLPFGYLIDRWRWDVMRGKVAKQDYNRHWWQLRLDYQGIIAPVPRSEHEFDPGAKYHIPSNSPYICYFVSFIIQFQFYEAMCEASGHQGELHNCDFYESIAAGEKLLEMLRLGKSKPWKDAMDVLTGTREISTKSIWTYFQPLYVWLQKENKRLGAVPGWKDAKINWED